MKKVVCTIADNGAVTVELSGEHLRKREQLRVLKAIKLECRHSARLYRQNLMAKASKLRVEADEKDKIEAENVGVKNGEDRITESEQPIGKSVGRRSIELPVS